MAILYLAYFLGFTVVTILIYLLFFTNHAKMNRKLKNTHEKDVNDIQSGDYVKIIGKVVFGNETLIAPLSGRKCSGYHIKIEQAVRSHNNKIYWMTVLDMNKIGVVLIKKMICMY